MLRRGRTTVDATRLRRRGLRLSQQVFFLYAGIVVVVIVIGVFIGVVVSDHLVKKGAEDRVLSVAQTVAAMPELAEALQTEEPSARIQPLAEHVRHKADVSFVVVASVDGVRYSHPNPKRIGGQFIGTYEPATRGEIVLETYEGTLGPSVRAVVPVYGPNPGDPPIAIASAGVTVDRIGDQVLRVLPQLIGAALAALALASAASWWVARRLSRQTFGMDATELAEVYAHHDAVLHAVREGLLVVDANRRVVLINDAARQLLGVGTEVQGQPVEELPVAGAFARLLASGETVQDEAHLAGERLVVVSQVPVGSREAEPAPGSETLGTVLTMRDHTQVTALADELSATRSMADALRAHAHESANRLHTIVMLVQLGDADAAVRLATGEVRATKALTSRLVGQFEEPTLVALLLGKVAEAARRSVELVISDDSRLTAEVDEPVDLVTIVGNLIDNAMDAALAGTGESPRVEVTIRVDETHDELLVQVRDSGLGFSSEALTHVFEPGWSSKPVDADRSHGRGIGMALVKEVAVRRGGSVEVANADGDDGTGLVGAMVVVRLPLPAEAEAEVAAGADGDELAEPAEPVV